MAAAAEKKKRKECEHEGCCVVPVFNFNNESSGRFCKAHRCVAALCGPQQKGLQDLACMLLPVLCLNEQHACPKWRLHPLHGWPRTACPGVAQELRPDGEVIRKLAAREASHGRLEC
jgi:hypothetical protein